MVVGYHQQPTIVASFFDNVKGLQMLYQQPLFDSHMAAIFFDNGNIIGNIPTITPFAIYVGNCHLASSAHTLLERSELGSFHGPHTFSKVSPFVVMRRSELGLTIMGRVGARGQPSLRRVLARAGMSHVRILRRFH